MSAALLERAIYPEPGSSFKVYESAFSRRQLLDFIWGVFLSEKTAPGDVISPAPYEVKIAALFERKL
jgi:hypothetical protein